MEQRFIVAEVSKTWTHDAPSTNLLCQGFEKVINTNYERGYHLKDWKISSVVGREGLNETIIAIFEKD